MSTTPFLLFFILITAANYPFSLCQLFPSKTTPRLSKPLIDPYDGRIYACSDKTFMAFENNGSIIWSLYLAHTCNSTMPPVHAGKGKVFLVAENRILIINFQDLKTSHPTVKVFYGPEKGHNDNEDVIGLAVSTSSLLIFINIKYRGLFSCTMSGKILWSISASIPQSDYRLGCRKSEKDCYFSSIPVIDRCEASLFMSNNAGELYSLTMRTRSPFNWVKDLSSYDKDFTITPGNNGIVYITIPTKAMVLALGVSRGNILWQANIGPLSSADCRPVVDSNGWMSIGSLDGFLYSISPYGDVKKFIKESESYYVMQVSPILDCSGYAIYISQGEMVGKFSQYLGGYNHISAMRPNGAVFTLLDPSTGAVYWSEKYPGPFSSIFNQSDLKNYAVDERIILTFVAASRIGNPLECRSRYEQLLSTCSLAKPKHSKIYTGNERKIIVFLLLETTVLVVLAGLVRFCCIFWSKKKLQFQDLGNFLEKRRSLQIKKKEFDWTIRELERKAAEEAVGNEVVEQIGDLVRKRQGIERKLSTTYSLGRDGTNINKQKNSILPVYDKKSRSYSLRNAKKENVSIFHTLSATTTSTDDDLSSWETAESEEQGEYQVIGKGKAKVPIIKIDSSSSSSSLSSSDDNARNVEFVMDSRCVSEPGPSSAAIVNPFYIESVKRRSRRSAKSSTNWC